MNKRGRPREIKAGDVFAVPLNSTEGCYGYVRMYNDPDISILGVMSKKRLLSIDEVRKYPGVIDAFSLRTAIEKGQWPYIGEIPFKDESEAWPGPKKQVAKIRPDLKMVVYRGDVIAAEEFGEYESLPEWKKFTDEKLIEEIISHPELFVLLS